MASVSGVVEPLWFGTGIHYALERYYNPVIKEDPVIAFETWFNLQWRGGVIDASEVKQYADRDPQPIPKEVTDDSPKALAYKVDGLKDILPDGIYDEDKFLGYLDLGKGMMEFYKGYSEAHDNFTVILVEHDFSVPVLDKDGAPMYAIDKRVMPEGWEPDFDKGNEFGPLIRRKNVDDSNAYYLEKQVHTRGRQDMIKQDNEFGNYGILDYKTAAKVDDDYFRHLDLDEQCTSYLAFGELEARLYDLEFKDLDHITYQAMLKGYPKPPSILKSGLPSLNRTEETTTAEMFEKHIIDNGLKPIFDLDPKMQSYYTYLLELGDKRYVRRTDTHRNPAQRKNAMTRLYYEAQDMLNDPVPYPNPTKNYGCLNCVFRGPCIAAESGDDYAAMLEDGFMPNWDR
jgi:hypothetical protein